MANHRFLDVHTGTRLNMFSSHFAFISTPSLAIRRWQGNWREGANDPVAQCHKPPMVALGPKEWVTLYIDPIVMSWVASRKKPEGLTATSQPHPGLAGDGWSPDAGAEAVTQENHACCSY